MNTVFKKTFLKEIEKITDSKIKESIVNVIGNVENSNSIIDIRQLKKLSGFSKYYRIRLGNFRIGIYIENNTVYFARFGHRKDIYKQFP